MTTKGDTAYVFEQTPLAGGSRFTMTFDSRAARAASCRRWRGALALKTGRRCGRRRAHSALWPDRGRHRRPLRDVVTADGEGFDVSRMSVGWCPRHPRLALQPRFGRHRPVRQGTSHVSGRPRQPMWPLRRGSSLHHCRNGRGVAVSTRIELAPPRPGDGSVFHDIHARGPGPEPEALDQSSGGTAMTARSPGI